ncbi:MAG: hypothetical protein AAGE03_02300 [Pseudomonadota bacterium]
MGPDPDALSSPAATEAQRRARARERRADAARLLPFLGAALLLAPDLILSGHPAAEGATAPWLNYLFAAWLVLIGLAAWIARLHLRDGGPGGGP